MASSNNRPISHSLKQQHFDFFAVIDFEATCEANPPPPDMYVQEIIEFPIAMVDAHNRIIIDTFQSYCRPVINPNLSDFCKQLTGITQQQVNSAPVFADVFVLVEQWLMARGYLSFAPYNFICVSDGPSDFLRYLRMQCELSHVAYPKWANQWVDVKKSFSNFYSIRKGRIADMLGHMGLQPQGHLHCGLDDAKNIGRIVIELIKNGCLLIPTDSYYPKSKPRTRQSAVSQIQTTTIPHSLMAPIRVPLILPSQHESKPFENPYDDNNMDTS